MRWFRFRHSFCTEKTWNEVMEPPGHQRSMASYDPIPKIIFRILDFLQIMHGHSKTNVTCFTRHKEHAGRWNFALATSEAKLSAITGFRHFSALDLTSEVTLVDLGPNYKIYIIDQQRPMTSYDLVELEINITLTSGQGRRRRGVGGGGWHPHFWKPGMSTPQIREWSGQNPVFFRFLEYSGVGWPPCRRFDPPPHSKIRGDAPASGSVSNTYPCLRSPWMLPGTTCSDWYH